MILIVASNRDLASLNIKTQILRNYTFQETVYTYQHNSVYTTKIGDNTLQLITLCEESFRAQYLSQDFPDAQMIVFISRHSSQSGKPTLSVHTPGNFGEAELGGLPRKVSVAPAFAMQTALKTMMQSKEQLNLNYEVSYECTHHGPSLNVPTIFVELGSCEMQWRDEVAAQAVAHAAMASIATFSVNAGSAVLGIGGTHYNQKFTLMALMGRAVFGHMVPKYAVSLMDMGMLRECMERTLERVPLVLLDWKGIKSEDKAMLLSTLETMGLPYKKV